MSNNMHGLQSFMRGGQYLAHIVNMVGQNIVRGLAVVLFLAVAIGSYLYMAKFDGYDKYVISIEASYLMKVVTPIGKTDLETHKIDLLGPMAPDQKYQQVLLEDRRLVPWYDYERTKTIRKLKNSGWLIFLDSVLVLILLSMMSSTLGRLITKDKQTRGARMVSKRELIREVRAFNKTEAKSTNQIDYRPYNIEEVEFPLGSEKQHTLLGGTTGAGKTQLLFRLMSQVHSRGDRAIIYDKMRSFVPKFFNPETDHILNPLDKRCPPWDLFADARNIVEWTSVATSIIKADNENDYWAQGARAIFANTANRLQEQCKENNTRPLMTDLLYLLTQTSVEDLNAFLMGTEAARHIDPRADKQAASMLSTLSQSITCLGFIKDSTLDNPGFSIRKWMADDTLKGKLFLTSRDDQHATLQPLLTMWMSLCTTSLMSQERSNNRICWFFIDELPSLNRLPDLEAGMAQARQYGGAYVLGIQLESQLQATYDEKGAQTIMGLTLNKAIFNPGDNNTAKTMADAIGKTEIIRRNEGISLGANRIRDGVSMNSQITQEHIVLPEELMTLPNLSFYLKMRGAIPCALIQMTYTPIDGDHEGYIPDLNVMTRYAHKMSSEGSADEAKKILRHIRDTKSAEPQTRITAPEAVAVTADLPDITMPKQPSPTATKDVLGTATAISAPTRIDALTGAELQGLRPNTGDSIDRPVSEAGGEPEELSGEFLSYLAGAPSVAADIKYDHIVEDVETDEGDPIAGSTPASFLKFRTPKRFSDEAADEADGSDQHGKSYGSNTMKPAKNTPPEEANKRPEQVSHQQLPDPKITKADRGPSMRPPTITKPEPAKGERSTRPGILFGGHKDDRGR